MTFWNLEPSADGETLDVSIFGEIDGGFFSDGVASNAIAEQLKAHAQAKRINVRINSVGGDAFGGIAIYNLLRGHGAEVVATVDGIAASAASIIAMAGRTVMGRGSMMMIHDPWAIVAGGADDLRQKADVLDKLRDSLVSVYQAKTGKKPGELRALLKAETWMTAEEAKAAGFADEIADKKIKAMAVGETVYLNSVGFKRAGVPAQLLAMVEEVPVVEAPADPAPEQEPAAQPAAEPAPVEPAPAAGEPQAAARPRAFTRELLAAEAPEILAALLAEGRAAASADHAAALVAATQAGVAAERARLRAIDELVHSPDDAVFAAKYGEQPQTAETLAVALLKAQRGTKPAAELLAARRAESAPAVVIAKNNPDASRHEDERAVASQIAAFANRRRGGAHARDQ